MQLLQRVFAKWSEAKAKRLFQRAMENEKNDDVSGTILACSAIIDMPSVPAEWLAKALVHRARAHWQKGEIRDAIDDLERVLEMDDAPDEMKKLAWKNKHSYLGRH